MVWREIIFSRRGVGLAEDFLGVQGAICVLNWNGHCGCQSYSSISLDKQRHGIRWRMLIRFTKSVHPNLIGPEDLLGTKISRGCIGQANLSVSVGINIH